MRISKTWGWALPVGSSILLILSASWLADDGAVRRGIFLGVAIALMQTFASTGAMKLAWEKRFFYWVWGGGILARLVILAATAFLVYRTASFNLIATLVTLVTASTLFLVIESYAFFVR